MLSEVIGAGGIAGLMMGSIELGFICFLIMSILELFVYESKQETKT